MRRRILLAVSGLSPQILTETVYALAIGSTEKWIPDEIHLITTLRGREHAENNLLKGNCWFHRLCDDYKLQPIAFEAEQHIHVIQDAEGNQLEDIRTPQDNEAAADTITELVRHLTKDDDSELHVSIAGGRKTMGYYAGYALSLFGRDQDRLSHVLVSSPYESHREFYYPTPYVHIIHTTVPENRTVDCQFAQVLLADIPFVRMRDGLLPQPLWTGQATFSETVAAVLQPAPVRLVFNPLARTVICGDKRIKLTGASFGIYAWIARRAKDSQEPLQFDRYKDMAIDSAPLLRELRRIDPDMLGQLGKIEQTLERNKGVTSSWFDTNLSRLQAVLKKELGEKMAKPYLIKNEPNATLAHNESSYMIPISAARIDLGD